MTIEHLSEQGRRAAAAKIADPDFWYRISERCLARQNMTMGRMDLAQSWRIAGELAQLVGEEVGKVVTITTAAAAHECGPGDVKQAQPDKPGGLTFWPPPGVRPKELFRVRRSDFGNRDEFYIDLPTVRIDGLHVRVLMSRADCEALCDRIIEALTKP